jgi:hypothetical protein
MTTTSTITSTTTGQFRRTLRSIWQISRKLVVTLAGGALLLGGAAMLVLPGPGLLAIGLGLALLSTEYRWARRARNRIVNRTAALRRRVTARRRGSGCRPLSEHTSR